jgi:hypothetical protein
MSTAIHDTLEDGTWFTVEHETLHKRGNHGQVDVEVISPNENEEEKLRSGLPSCVLAKEKNNGERWDPVSNSCGIDDVAADFDAGKDFELICLMKALVAETIEMLDILKDKKSNRRW